MYIRFAVAHRVQLDINQDSGFDRQPLRPKGDQEILAVPV